MTKHPLRESSVISPGSHRAARAAPPSHPLQGLALLLPLSHRLRPPRQMRTSAADLPPPDFPAPDCRSSRETSLRDRQVAPRDHNLAPLTEQQLR
eukprot:351643-Pleurochrysis_carterae.AAC.2